MDIQASQHEEGFVDAPRACVSDLQNGIVLISLYFILNTQKILPDSFLVIVAIVTDTPASCQQQS